ncbi:MAG: DUF1553 domain-containing protein [Planctomycetota bacterium]
MSLTLAAVLFLQAGAPPWWSREPLAPAKPLPAGAHPVDSFLLQRLAREGLKPARETDRLTLYRRLSFDLTGLPPAPEAARAFAADTRPDALERAISRLLESPSHGERMARLWLDVAHYGDTHGYDKDKLRPNAWPYRDWLIRAFNADIPYPEFVMMQLAGDKFPGAGPGGIEALGFLAAGPWDFIGHAEVPESKIDGQIARHLDRDDFITTVCNTFLGITVQCAQCHDHKFDPVTQRDYYRLQAVFAAIDRADKRYYPDPKTEMAAAAAEKALESARAKRESLAGRELALLGPRAKEWTDAIARLSKPAAGADPRSGWHSGIHPGPKHAEWVEVDLGEARDIASVVLHPCHDDYNGIGAGFGFPVRYELTVSDNPDHAAPRPLAVRTGADVANPGLAPVPHEAKAKGRFVRLTVSSLAHRSKDYIAAVAEMRVLDPAGANLAKGRPVRASSSIEAKPRWARENLTDGVWAGNDSNRKGDITELAAKLAKLRETRLPKEFQNEVAEADSALSRARAAVDALPKPSVVYAGTVHNGTGAFKGTGPDGGKPRTIHILKRGNIKQPGEEVGPGGIASLAHAPAEFNIPAQADEGERRLALARWIAHKDNPLFWRVIVNRVWRWHFGRGLADTPNDLGRMGEVPEHRELLDHLAAWFRDNGGSFRKLHMLLLTSAAYRRAATDDPAARAKDPDNRLLWRGNRRKLDAESLRDAMLAVSGTLDSTMFGPPFMDFVITHPAHSPHYEYDLFDQADKKARRRSVYRFIVRSQQQPFMTVLDCADPSQLVDRRNETISPLQALALLNNDFVLVMSRELAARVERESPGAAGRVARAVELALGRPATATESAALEEHAGRHGLASACRVIFNLNAFAFAD